MIMNEPFTQGPLIQPSSRLGVNTQHLKSVITAKPATTCDCQTKTQEETRLVESLHLKTPKGLHEVRNCRRTHRSPGGSVCLYQRPPFDAPPVASGVVVRLSAPLMIRPSLKLSQVIPETLTRSPEGANSANGQAWVADAFQRKTTWFPSSMLSRISLLMSGNACVSGDGKTELRQQPPR